MKIALIADLHLNRNLYKGVMDKEFPELPFRACDFMRAFRFAVDKNIDEIKPNLIVILGDIYDTYDPSNPIRAFFNQQVKKILDAQIPIIILSGNHDVCGRHSSLSPIHALGLKHVKIIETPKMVPYQNKLLMLFPFSMEVERSEIEIREQFHNFIDECHKKIEATPDYQGKEILFFGHFGVKGAVLNSYGCSMSSAPPITEFDKAKKVLVNKNEGDISLNDLDTIGASHIFLGDYHQHQLLPCKNVKAAFYIGSLEKGDYSEKNQKKGFAVYDDTIIPGVHGQYYFVENTTCRPMIELEGTYDQMVKSFNEQKEAKKALVNLNFEGNDKELLEYSIQLDDFKKKIENKFEPVYVITQQKVIDNEEEKEASQVE
jgi:DNA repair exonuclease SbcCD nuclease subunit